MKPSALIPEDNLLLKCSIEAGASLAALDEGNKKIFNKRKVLSICIQYCRKRRRIKSGSFNSPDLSSFDNCKKLQDHATLDREAYVDDAMFIDHPANNNGSMREDGLCKLTENVCFLLTDNLMTFFNTGIEPIDDSHMHDKGDSDNSSAVTEVEYASLPDSLWSFSDKDYIVCSLNTEDTIDDIPDSQLLDSFDGDQQDVYHCEDDVESTSISHLNPVHRSEGKITCILNTEDPEIPCNDHIFLLIHPSPYVSPQTATESIDPALSFSQSQMDGPNLSSESNSANPHVGCTLKSVSMDHSPSISDNNNSDSDSDLPCFTDTEDPEIPYPSVSPQPAIDSIDPTSSFTQSRMDGPDLSSEFGSTDPQSVSMDHNPSISDHNSHSDLPCFPDIEDSDTPSPSVRPQTITGSIDSASCLTQLQMDGPDLSSEFDSANPHVGCTRKPSLADHNIDSDLHLPCVPDTEDPKIPSPSVRPQTVTESIDPKSSFPQLQMDGPDLSVDDNPSISDHNNSDSDNDLPCFPDIEALILKLDFEYAQESWITNEVNRGKYRNCNRSISRLKQSSHQRVMSSLGAFAVFYSRHFNYYIKKTEVTIGRSTNDTEVDIDLSKESHANMISRQQATIKMETDGTFALKNIGKGSVLVNGESVAHGHVGALGSSCLIQIRGMGFKFEMNDRYVRWYLDNIMKKTQGKFTTFEWSVN